MTLLLLVWGDGSQAMTQRGCEGLGTSRPNKAGRSPLSFGAETKDTCYDFASINWLLGAGEPRILLGGSVNYC
jgi:hypothetical protein